MPLFVIQWKDKAVDGPGIRAATRPAHLEWLAGKSGMVKLAGPFLSADGAMAGSLLVIEAESLEAARDFHAEDPYTKAGLYEHSSVDLWKASLGSVV